MLLPYLIAWMALLALLGLSVLTAYLPLGHFHPLANFSIAIVQAAIVFTIFMRLREPPPIKRVFAGAGFFWLTFLFGIGIIDYLTRAH
ncbi:MAG TPA: cytochrome C oxidase subunit IV family protein [Stellaceae bacterium]|jgi:caa(3)-type oxidase subunit IV|nr:cytochrome C oxidase subunit IV family protein [Stellaceae bacterium]